MEFLHEIFKSYEEVHKLSYFARISHEAVVHPKSESHYCPSLESPWLNPNLLLITDTDIDWVDLADDIRHEYYVVDNLRPSHGYKFRVLARNKFGWSIPSIPSGIVMTPSTGASKAEFYDALQALQVRISNRQQPLL